MDSTVRTSSTPPVVRELVSVVDRLVAAVETSGASASRLDGQAAADALLALRTQLDRLAVASARLATTVEADGVWALEGARSFPHWLAGMTGMPFHRARELTSTGRALRDHLPATACAALAGAIGADQAHLLAKLAPTSDARRLALTAAAEECGEEFLVAHARALPAASFRRLVQRWAAAADPEADERGYRDACEREHVTLSATTAGIHLTGFLTTDHGAVLSSALTSVMTPPAPDDHRSTPQRHAQALADVARICLDHGLVGTGAAVRPHLSCVVDYDTLRRAVGAPAGLQGATGTGRDGLGRGLCDGVGRGPHEGGSLRLSPVADVERFAVGELLGSGPVPASVLARLACDSEISRIVFGPDSQVINAGRAERTFAGPRRKAVIARDGTCRYPGCSAPPALCEVHHVDGWAARQGETDVNRGVLLCWHHHDVVHRRQVQIGPSPGGGFEFRTRHGTPVARSA
ncbi:DUF222 domain-containing protein [Cellulomonas sp. NTE-D12]|uniref:HNH endonuclease signature motif containing protein n=1 Tax=Cellulomonas sp. NTE-D12 TaxID=2962632 RepID=UPI003081B83F